MSSSPSGQQWSALFWSWSAENSGQRRLPVRVPQHLRVLFQPFLDFVIEVVSEAEEGEVSEVLRAAREASEATTSAAEEIQRLQERKDEVKKRTAAAQCRFYETVFRVAKRPPPAIPKALLDFEPACIGESGRACGGGGPVRRAERVALKSTRPSTA